MGVWEESSPVKKRGRKGGSTRSKGPLGNVGVGVVAGELAGNGMRDVWVLGEGFFRGVGGVFDVSCLLRYVEEGGWCRRFADGCECSSRRKGWALGRTESGERGLDCAS